MSQPLYANNVSTTLASGINSSTTTITITSATGWPSPDYSSPWYNSFNWATVTDGTNVEIVKVTARSSTTLTVVRGEQGTTAQSWSAGATIAIRWTADDGVFRIPSSFPISLTVDGDAMLSRNNGNVYMRWSGSDYPLVRGPGSGTIGDSTLVLWDGNTGGLLKSQGGWKMQDIGANDELYPSSAACRFRLPTLPSPDPTPGVRGRIWIHHTNNELVIDNGSALKTIALV